ncbi:hypothetical protein GA707_18935 [Nostocoides sp. F2B08]|uniref:hypothetical protein n=1 Tax=Nostocoides sp. F2B08 TaxID=2653936 RepID=UPI001262FA12|nr:hypothetical protein [Tetrasphaera sp. F2B08]KAB7740967.1 hypothetical protein GA707_18935 [Tetrasphaera sp. F2B08]
MTATIETEGEQAQRQRIARLRGIRFLAAHALAAGDADAFHVGCTGIVSIQGGRGCLAQLVQLLDAQPAESESEMFSEWTAAVTFEGGTVTVELTEGRDN